MGLNDAILGGLNLDRFNNQKVVGTTESFFCPPNLTVRLTPALAGRGSRSDY